MTVNYRKINFTVYKGVSKHLYSLICDKYEAATHHYTKKLKRIIGKYYSYHAQNTLKG